MFCSYIVPTIGRQTLDRAVRSVLEQNFSSADVEVIVVNDSTKPLEAADWLFAPRVRVINTNRCERSFARNTGAALATGEYLAFLDDDDWILPNALEKFWSLAAQDPDASWLYGGIRIVVETGEILAEINSGLNGNCFAQIMGGAWTPLQASMIRASAFFEAGGFSPFINGTEDEDLCRRIAYSRKFANIPAPVACLLRGQSWSTSTNYSRAAEDTKYSRDSVLSKPGAFRRLWISGDSSYWRGRTLRVYLSTIPFVLKKKRLFTSMSRAFYSLLWILFSIRNMLHRDYWRGLRAHHVPESLHFVMLDYDNRLRERLGSGPSPPGLIDKPTSL